ncbi:MAG: SgcJ/EcaC family oxidoreductase [Alphaproteobacteria bacterium]|nr:SgcJ/EcaC family oxidoreductase [Alphaproteobacteria bacterium]
MSQTPTIEIFLAKWIDAFNRHDLDSHMELYLEDATLFGSVDELQIGRDKIRSYFSRRGPEVRVESYPMPRVAMLAPDIAVTAGHVEFADGTQPMPYRVTWVLVRRDGNWRIAQHHGSRRLES